MTQSLYAHMNKGNKKKTLKKRESTVHFIVYTLVKEVSAARTGVATCI
jgi:hypothetical protein